MKDHVASATIKFLPILLHLTHCIFIKIVNHLFLDELKYIPMKTSQ